jgi:large subunit ribosomal protein L15
MPLQRRLPKRGFRNPFRVEYSIVNLASSKPSSRRRGGRSRGAREARPRPHNKKIKVLGQGALSKALTVKAHAFSESAKAAIDKAGGSTEVVSGA